MKITFLKIAILAVMAFVLGGCGSSSSEPTTEPVANQALTPTNTTSTP